MHQLRDVLGKEGHGEGNRDEEKSREAQNQIVHDLASVNNWHSEI